MLRKVPFYHFTVPVSGSVDNRIKVVLELIGKMNEDLGWNDLKIRSNIKVTPVALGLTNQLYKCELDTDNIQKNIKNMQVMVRVYGQGSEEMLDREEEINIMAQVIKNYVKCRFDNGIVVDYFPGECLRPLDLLKDKYQRKIAKEMAKLHKIQLQGENIETKDWFSRIQSWLNIINTKLPNFEFQIKETNELINISSLQNDYNILKNIIHNKNYPKTCSHGDINAENCIYDVSNDTIRFIDYEYACNFFKGFDIGNHFCEYAGVERNLDFANYFPSKSEREKFIEYYCESYYGNKDNDNIEKIKEESIAGSLISHYFWGIWGIVQSTCSQLDFDFLDYGTKRLIEFKTEKNKEILKELSKK